MKENSAQPTILVADDHPTNVGLLFEMLSHAGYRVLVAENGKAAMERARKGNPDLIILDVMMPEMDGFEACAALKRDPATAAIPIIFATALADNESRTRAFQLGANDFLTKPLSRQPTLACVAKHLSRTAAKDSLPQPPAARSMPAKESTTAAPELPEKKEVETNAMSADALLPTALHDLRGSLGGALGFLENLEIELQEDAPDLPTMRDFSAWMRRSLASMEEALQVLALGRGLHSHVAESSPCPLAEILQAAAERTAEFIPSPAISLAGAETAPTVESDRLLLEQFFFLLFRAFLGLIDDVPSVTVEVRAMLPSGQGKGITLEVPGEPLNAKECAIFFEPFKEGKRQRLRSVGISPCGLQILAQTLRLETTAEPSKAGTRFHFTFPR
ncbi:MAG: response regulator [Opitutales bacterium]|nr:response regulator [Opitutales bacterium]